MTERMRELRQGRERANPIPDVNCIFGTHFGLVKQSMHAYELRAGRGLAFSFGIPEGHSLQRPAFDSENKLYILAQDSLEAVARVAGHHVPLD